MCFWSQSASTSYAANTLYEGQAISTHPPPVSPSPASSAGLGISALATKPGTPLRSSSSLQSRPQKERETPDSASLFCLSLLLSSGYQVMRLLSANYFNPVTSSLV